MRIVRFRLLRSIDGEWRGSAPALPGALLLCGLLAGCGGDAPSAASSASTPAAAPADGAAVDAVEALPPGSLEAVALELGTAVDADGRVSTPTERVRASDAVNVSLVTVGEADAATLAIAWRDAAGAEIDADEREITAAGPAVHTFTRKPEGGWPPGRYEAEVSINGESAGVRGFEVR